MPFISRVASRRLEELSIFGGDYDTPDGTGVRDYVHVTDLAAGHIAALAAITRSNNSLSTWNLGTGQGYSVLEMVEAFEDVNGVSVPYRIAERRPGDIASSYASPDNAKTELGWEATLGLAEMCASMWRFERMLATSNNAELQRRGILPHGAT
jgi:UDP-glucose 4-epimerase